MTALWLILAILSEVGWAVAMKCSSGFSRLVPSVITVIMYGLSVVFLALAAKRMEVGTAYAIWAGCGVTLTAVAGMIWLGEPMTALKLASIVLIGVGIFGLQIAGGGH